MGVLVPQEIPNVDEVTKSSSHCQWAQARCTVLYSWLPGGVPLSQMHGKQVQQRQWFKLTQTPDISKVLRPAPWGKSGSFCHGKRVVSRAREAGSSSAVCLRELAQVSFQKACTSERLAMGGHEEEEEMLVLSSVWLFATPWISPPGSPVHGFLKPLG